MSRYPKAIEVDGITYPLDTSYQVALECFNIINDEEISDIERGCAIMIILLGDIPETKKIEDVQKLLIRYLQCGCEENRQKEMVEIIGDQEPDMDYVYDFGLITASFISEYQIDLSDQKNDEMHWWKFMDLLNGLSPKCALNRVRDIRTRDLSEIKDPKYREDLIKAKKMVALPSKISTEEQEALDEFELRLKGLYQEK